MEKSNNRLNNEIEHEEDIIGFWLTQIYNYHIVILTTILGLLNVAIGLE